MEECKKMTIKELSKKIHENAKSKGFYDLTNKLIDFVKNEPELLQHVRNLEAICRIALIQTELSEAIEAIRNNKYSGILLPLHLDSKIFEKQIKDTHQDEISDTFIRLLDYCEYANINLVKHTEYKMHYNKSRSKLHGKKI